MPTLHELLKRDAADVREHAPHVDLRRRYSPIGISAVAAACRYSHETDDRTDDRGQGRPEQHSRIRD